MKKQKERQMNHEISYYQVIEPTLTATSMVILHKQFLFAKSVKSYFLLPIDKHIHN